MLDIPYYADDGQPGRAGVDTTHFQTLAERVIAGPVSSGHVFVNDHGLHRFFYIMLAEEATPDQRNFHRLEITRAGNSEVWLDNTLPRCRGILFNCDPSRTVASGMLEECY